MSKLDDRDIDSIVGMLYDLDILYEDDHDDLKDELENSLDKRHPYFIERNESLVVFFSNRFYESVEKEIYKECEEFVQQSGAVIVLFEVENSFKDFMPDEDVEDLYDSLSKEIKNKIHQKKHKICKLFINKYR